MADRENPGAEARRPTAWRAAFILLCLAAGGLIGYAHTLPDRIGENDPRIRRQLFGDPLRK